MDLRMEQIQKSYGANTVLRDVDFRLGEGEICALLGENGAGKSTLMNILGGVTAADGGRIILDGVERSFRSPVESLDAGIGFIHQELNLIPDLTVYENIFITHLPTKGAFLDSAAMQERVRELFSKMEIELDPRTIVRELDASYKQIVEICRALMQNASIIIMDEPTTSLTGPEIERIFSIMRTLKERRVSIIFISHKLGEVMEICDRYTVLRDGVIVADGQVSETNTKALASYMVGHEITSVKACAPASAGKEVLRLEGLSGRNFDGVSLSVRAGEILGVTGLLGDGRSELFRCVFGDMGRHYSGKIFLSGREVRITSTHGALDSSIAYLPRNRKENAIIPDMNILDNGTIVTLDRFVRGLFIDEGARREAFSGEAGALGIKMGAPEDGITSLSGGNQQKVVLAKWLSARPKLLILDNPTQGVDVGAKEDIYGIINSLAAAGGAVIVLSSEAQEIIRVSHRALVMFHGRVAGELSGEAMTEQNIMYLATGGSSEGVNQDGKNK